MKRHWRPQPRLPRPGLAVCIAHKNLEFDDADFVRIGRDFERETEAVTTVSLGAGTVRVFEMTALVDYAAEWMRRHRG